jgi:hypothetical protein
VAGDLSFAERDVRKVAGGVLFPGLYKDKVLSSEYTSVLDCVAGNACFKTAIPKVTSITLLRAIRQDIERTILIEGTLLLDKLRTRWYPSVVIKLEGEQQLTLVANVPDGNDDNSLEFAGKVPFSSETIRNVQITACHTPHSDGTEVCSNALNVELRPPYNLKPDPEVTPIAYVYLHPQHTDLEKEELISLHRMISRLYKEGHLDMRSLLYTEESYNLAYTDTVHPNPMQLTPKDAFIIHEQAPDIEIWCSTLNDIGTMPIILQSRSSLTAIDEKYLVEFEPLKLGHNLNEDMHSTILNFFRTNLHIMIPGLGQRQGEQSSPNILSSFLSYSILREGFPFASSEIVVEEMGNGFIQAFFGLFGNNIINHISTVPPEFAKHGELSVLFTEPHNRHYRDYVLIMPPGTILLYDGGPALMLEYAKENDCDVLKVEKLMLVRRERYYPAAQYLALSKPKFTVSSIEDVLYPLEAKHGLKICRENIASIVPCPVVTAEITELAWSVRGLHNSCFCMNFMELFESPSYRTKYEKLQQVPEPILTATVERLAAIHSFCRRSFSFVTLI